MKELLTIADKYPLFFWFCIALLTSVMLVAGIMIHKFLKNIAEHEKRDDEILEDLNKPN